METSAMMAETEVVAKAARRRFSAAEKVRVLREADGCTKPGELSALLRGRGLDFSLDAQRVLAGRNAFAGTRLEFSIWFAQAGRER